MMVPNDVLALAHGFLDTKRIPALDAIDGRFLLDVYDETWVGEVQAFRDRLGPMLGLELPAQGLNVNAVLSRADEETKEFIEGRSVERARETGLAVADILAHLLCGMGLQLPRYRIVVGGQQQLVNRFPWALPRISFLVYTDDMSAKEVADEYRRTIEGASDVLAMFGEADPSFRRRQLRVKRHDASLTVRTWTVLCLIERARMRTAEAIDLWNEHFPKLSYGDPEEKNHQQGRSVTTSAMVQFSRDRANLLGRLHLTAKAA